MILRRQLFSFRFFTTHSTLPNSGYEIVENISQGRYTTLGNFAQIKYSFQQEDVNQFARLCGDMNPIHLDSNYVLTTTKFKGTICHGILVSSLFSTLFGRLLPGCLYLKQNLNFVKPVYVNDVIFAKVIIEKVEIKRIGHIVYCQTLVFHNDEKQTIAINGDASVLIPTPKKDEK